MRWRLVIRIERIKRAVATGVAASVVFTLLAPVPGNAETSLQYRDEFTTESFDGSHGATSWAGPWIEVGEDGGADPGDGAIEIKNAGHCHTGACMQLGKGDDVDASIKRAFSSAGASSGTLRFDYRRHPHAAGEGEVQVLVSPNGTSWSLVARYPLDVDDGTQRTASHDLPGLASAGSMIKFALVGNTDDSHMNIDNVEIGVVLSTSPEFNQDLSDRSDVVGDTVSIDASATDPDSPVAQQRIDHRDACIPETAQGVNAPDAHAAQEGGRSDAHVRRSLDGNETGNDAA
jgi:hypothetical protein